MTMGKATWDLQKHIDELHEWESSHNIYQGFTPFQPKQSLSQGVPMDVDRKKSTMVRTQNLPKLTPQLHEELRKKGACFWCRKPGHMSHECPGPDSTPIATSSSKTTSSKGKNHKEVIEEVDDEGIEGSDEEQLKKQEKKKARKTKVTPSVASSSRTPVTRWTLFPFFSHFPSISFLSYSTFTLTWTVCYCIVVCRPYSGLTRFLSLLLH